MGKSDKESSTPPRAASPVVHDVVDGEKSIESSSESAVLVKPVEQASEAIEPLPTVPENKATDLKDGEKPVVAIDDKKRKSDGCEIPPEEGKRFSFLMFWE